MTFQEVIKKSGMPAAHLARKIGYKPQNLQQYITGIKGKTTGNKLSIIVKKVCDEVGVLRAEVFFEPVFKDPEQTNPDSHLYHVSIAVEALTQACERGFVPNSESMAIITEIVENRMQKKLAKTETNP